MYTNPEEPTRPQDLTKALQAALDGLGVAIASSALIADEVASERLAIPFAEPKLPGEGYYAYVTEGNIHHREAAAFCDWLRRICSARGEAADRARAKPGADIVAL